MQLATACHPSFLPMVSVLLRSLFAHHRPGEFEFTLLTSDASAEEVKKLRRAIAPHQRFLRVVESSRKLMLRAPAHIPHIRSEVWLKVLLPELVSRGDRLLYLDGDMMVRASLRELWETELGTKPLAAVRDADSFRFLADAERFFRLLGVAEGTPLLNSGLLLVDRGRWKALDCGRRLFAFARSHPRVVERSADQGPYNRIFKGAWLELPERWNTQWLVGNPRRHEGRPPSARQVTIAHFVGTPKPWQPMCDHRLAAEWRGYFDEELWGTPLPREVRGSAGQVPDQGRIWVVGANDAARRVQRRLFARKRGKHFCGFVAATASVRPRVHSVEEALALAAEDDVFVNVVPFKSRTAFYILESESQARYWFL